MAVKNDPGLLEAISRFILSPYESIEFFQNKSKIEFFFGKTVWHVSCPYSDEHSCAKAKKSLEPFFRKSGY